MGEAITATVLLVEDDVRQRDALRELFEELSPGTAVVAVGTLKDALAYDATPVDAIALDLDLPDSNGRETLTSIVGRFSPAPIIVLDDTSDARTGEEAIALGADDYVEKATIRAADIRRVARHAIRQSAARMAARAGSRDEELERILDALADCIFRFDGDLRLRYMNLPASRTFPLVTRGMHIDEFSVSAFHRERWKAGLERTRASRVSLRVDMDAPDASRRYEVSVIPLLDADSQDVILVLRDVTERARELARYETLFAADMIGVFFSDAEGVITQANGRFLEMVGRKRSEVVARRLTLETLMTPAAHTVHDARVQAIREGGVLPPLPAQLVHSNSSSVPVMLTSAVVERAPAEIVTLAIERV